MFQGTGIEWPRRPYFFETGEMIRFAGWLLAEPDDHVTLVAKYNNQVVSISPLNIVRRDVALAHDLDERRAKCGFDFYLAEGAFTEIEISLNGKGFEIWQAEPVCSTDIKELVDIKLLWAILHQSNLECLNNVDKKCEIDDQLLDSFFARLLIVREPDQVVARVKELDSDSAIEYEKLKLLADSLRNPNWAIDNIIKVEKEGLFALTSIYGNEWSVCIGSVAVGDFNYLIFRDGDHVFYITQFCGVVSVIFPLYFIVLGLSVADWVNLSRKNLIGVFNSLHGAMLANLGLLDAEANYFGLNVSQARPYHYFYDYLYGVMEIYKRVRQLPVMYSIKGYDFFNVSELFGGVSKENVFDSIELNSYLHQHRGFLISPCLQFCEVRDMQLLAELSDHLISYSSVVVGEKHESRNDLCEIGNSFPVLWIGISTEKRSWLEQIEGYSSIISNLKLLYPGISVIVDGRTFPGSPGDADYNQKKHEDLLCKRLMADNPDINYINLIGASPLEKIYFASRCDFFISSYATDSMYPSCVCRKPGVVYAPHAIGNQRHLHVHYDVLEVPSEYVKDCTQGENVQWHNVSVSIDWNIIFHMIARLIDDKFSSRN